MLILLNKPFGVLCQFSPQPERRTLADCVPVPGVYPAGRLDADSEGLLLLSNDTVWAAGITDPSSSLEKTYHVQINGLPDAAALHAMHTGVDADGEHLAALRAQVLRVGGRNAWLEVVLDEGRNRQIRRLMAALGYDVLRLVRVAIGPLVLGDLGKGQWRHLTRDEFDALCTTPPAPSVHPQWSIGSLVRSKVTTAPSRWSRSRTRWRLARTCWKSLSTAPACSGSRRRRHSGGNRCSRPIKPGTALRQAMKPPWHGLPALPSPQSRGTPCWTS